MNNLKKTSLLSGLLTCMCMTSAHAADRIRVVNEGSIRDQWMLADGVKLAAPGYPATFATRGDNVCVALGYAIKPDGTTSDFALLKAWTSSTAEKEPVDGFWEAFAQASAGALSQWKFKPRPEISSPQPTYTVATMHFMGKHATDTAGLRNHCKISDLPTLVESQKSQRSQRGSIERSSLEQFNRTRDSNRSLNENPGLGR